MKNIKNLVFSGSGSKIFMHLGFVQYLEEHNMISEVDTFIGTSGGAIVASLLSIGYGISTLTELFLQLNYDQLEKIDSDSILNFFENYGIDSGENMERALRIMFKNKLGTPHITFKELYNKNQTTLVICATNLQRHTEVFFDYKNYGDLDIIDAILMSIAIPFLFTPRLYNDELYVDGGILCNYPIEYIEKSSLNKDETLGIAIIPEYEMCKEELCDAGTQKKIDIPSFESYILNVLGCSIIKHLKLIYKKYKDITVVAVNNNNGLNFTVSRQIREQYILETYQYTKKYFEELPKDIQEKDDTTLVDTDIIEQNKNNEDIEEDESESEENEEDLDNKVIEN